MFVLHNYDTNTYPKQKGAEEIMKIAVMYISKTGSTQLCAEYIASKLHDCSLFDLDREIPCLSDFDVLLIGSGVRMGKIYKPAKQVLNDNIETLIAKKTIIFLCNFYPETIQKTIRNSIPNRLINHAKIIKCGGISPFSKPTNTEWLNCTEINEVLTAFCLM